jgi:hypothetical protein
MKCLTKPACESELAGVPGIAAAHADGADQRSSRSCAEELQSVPVVNRHVG